MKRLFLLIQFAIFAICIFAQNANQNAMFLYRTDGNINPFLLSDIDSITYSMYGPDSLLFDKVEIQVIWTQDSVYRIPVAEIDSISFTRPETKLQSDVVIMDYTWLPYIVSTDGMSITFNHDITNLWLPQTDVVLVYLSFDDIFPDGFAGRVSEISESGNYAVNCDSVSLDEIYETLMIFGEYDVVPDSEQPSKGRYRLAPHKAPADWNSSLDFQIPFFNDHLSFGVNMQITVSPFLSVTKDRVIFEMKISNEEAFRIGAEFTEPFVEKLIGDDLLKIKIPIPQTPLRLTFSMSPVIEMELRAGLNAELNFTTKSSFTMRMDNGVFSYRSVPRKGKPNLNLKTTLSGSIGVGTKFPVGVSTIGNILSGNANMTLSTGLECELSAGGFQNPNAYQLFYDTYADWYTKLDIGAELKMKVFKFEWKFSKDKLFSVKLKNQTWYLFPEFSDLNCNIQRDVLTSQVNVSRSLIIPVQLGFQFRKNNDNVRKYDSETYNGNTMGRILKMDYADLQPQTQYHISPIFKLFNFEIEATPDTVIYNNGGTAEVTNLNVNQKEYGYQQFTYNGSLYSYKYNCTTTVQLKDTVANTVEDWGYLYIDPNNDTAYISLAGKPAIYQDSRYVYYRNERKSTVKLAGYIKYYNSSKYYYGAVKVYDLVYDQNTGKFSVSPTKQVEFSPGNLQYQPSSGAWRFAPNQWDYVGEANANIDNPSYSGWIDLFGWGTGNNPTNYSTDYKDYLSFVDWGKNIGNGWRTLSYDEWDYLIEKRANAENLHGNANVDGIAGKILLPDDWSGEKVIPYEISGITYAYSFSEWCKMEQLGAVFLPAVGYRTNTYVKLVGIIGVYWASSIGRQSDDASSVYFYCPYDMEIDGGWWYNGFGDFGYRYHGYSVRLVKNVK